jgi:hypothetical protein
LTSFIAEWKLSFANLDFILFSFSSSVILIVAVR